MRWLLLAVLLSACAHSQPAKPQTAKCSTPGCRDVEVTLLPITAIGK